MKYVTLSLAAALLLSVPALSQNFQLGLKGGVNMSNFRGNDYQDVKANTLVGFHAGAFVNLRFGAILSVQPELLVSSQGAKLESSTQKENFKATYATLPIMVKLQSPRGGLYIEAGPQFGLKVSDKISGVNTDVKNLDAALAAGIGYHSAMGLGVGARYIAGLSKVGDIDFGGGVNPDYKNSTIQVSLFYTIFNRK
ncbi:porin family protein [Agriterribacter sp.]|uniref:porin family protein n=1 Tax=Agriterribacter sp. TaxID=2821509 RepID=UPI002C2F62FC|nr:porin family protein [Agriterribacter sp.]HRO48128.1 porin family protein [Agriterribacter sp.]HRQ19129.1 porin family protein [Agriterribacter sp.]